MSLPRVPFDIWEPAPCAKIIRLVLTSRRSTILSVYLLATVALFPVFGIPRGDHTT